jgi:hypothetical protein
VKQLNNNGQHVRKMTIGIATAYLLTPDGTVLGRSALALARAALTTKTVKVRRNLVMTVKGTRTRVEDLKKERGGVYILNPKTTYVRF